MKTFADQMLAAYREGRRFVPAGALPASAADAYAVQSQVAAALGPVAGFKVGLRPGAPPIMAPIMAARCLPPGAHVQVADRMGVELEVGWKVTATLPRPDAADLEAALAQAVIPVPVIELVDTRVDGAAAVDPWVKLADFQINHGLVLGSPQEDWTGGDFGEIRARMQAGDRFLLDGTARVPGGSAIATLAAFYRHAGGHCGGLHPGQVVITGSIHPLTYLPGGTRVAGEIEGLGAVSVTLD